MEIVTVGNEDFFLRRFILGNPSYMREDGTVTSYVFSLRKQDTDGLSGDLERLTNHKDSVVDIRKYGLLRISVSKIRSVNGLDCVHKPLNENYAHALITGQIKKGQQNQLVALSEKIDFDSPEVRATISLLKIESFSKLFKSLFATFWETIMASLKNFLAKARAVGKSPPQP